MIDETMGLFVGVVFGPYIPLIAGALLAFIVVIMTISFFRMSTPEFK